MDNWWLAASPWQCTHSCIMSHGEIFGEISNHPNDSAPLQPRSGALQLLALPKTKIAFEREEISDCQWGPIKYDRAADGDWEDCVRSKGAYFEGDWGIIVLGTMFLVPSSLSLFFIDSTWPDSFWTDLVYIHASCIFKKDYSSTFSQNQSMQNMVPPTSLSFSHIHTLSSQF